MFGLALNMPSIIGRAKLLVMVLLAKYEGFFGELFYRYFPEEVLQNYFGCHFFPRFLIIYDTRQRC